MKEREREEEGRRGEWEHSISVLQKFLDTGWQCSLRFLSLHLSHDLLIPFRLIGGGRSHKNDKARVSE